MKKEQTDKLNKQITELTNDLQRTRADFENYRKQIDAQKAREKETVKLSTINNFLPLIDDMARAIDSYAELKPLAKTLDKTMQDLVLLRIDSRAGVPFNPDLHEAVMVEGDGDKELIAETLRPGYSYKGEVLRAAMVKVKKT